MHIVANFDDLLAKTRLPEGSVPICLRGDLVARHEQLERDLAAAQNSDTAGSLAAGGQARKIAEEIEALERDMQEHTHDFVFRGLPAKQYRDLVEAHPPRKDNDLDAAFGADMSTFPVALIAACCVDPVMTVEQATQLADVLTEGQLMTMFTCAVGLNRSQVDVPKSVLASEILASSAPRSKRPGRGGSAGGGSSAGSLAG